MKIQIEKGIPMPARHRLSGLTEIIKKLSVGDSFVVPLDARSNMKGYANRAGIEITTSKINDKELRVWRIK